MPRGGVASLLDVFPRAWLERLRTRTQNGREHTHRPTRSCPVPRPGGSHAPRSRTAGRRRRDRARTGLIERQAGRARGLGTAL